MAKVYLTGRNPIEIAQKKAEEIQQKWQDGDLPKMVVTNSDSFRSRDIKGFSFEADVSIDDKFLDIDDDATRVEVKEFEKEFNQWKEKNNEDGVWAKEKYLEDRGFIKIKEGGLPSHFSVIASRSEEFGKVRKLFSALEELLQRREYKKQEEKEAVESIIEE